MPHCRQAHRILALLFGVVATSAVAQAQSAPDGFNPGANNQVNALAVQADGKVVVGGFFTGLGGGSGTIARSHVGRLNADGSVDTSFNPGANDNVLAIAIQQDGKILVAGQFTMLGGGGTGTTIRNRIGRLNPDGSLDSTFNPGANGYISEIVIQPDGRLLLGGGFTTLGGGGIGTTVRSSIGRLNADGSLDTGFNPGANGAVGAIVLQPDDRIVVGGGFTTLGGGGTGTTGRNRLGRLNANGSLDSTFNPGANGAVDQVALQPDGKIVVVGGFTMLGAGAGAVQRNYIGRVNADGTVDASFNPSADNVVNTIAVQPDGKIFVGGFFGRIGGASRRNLARLEADGSVDRTINPGASGNVLAIAVNADRTVTLGGQFTGLGGALGNIPRRFLGRLNGDPGGTITGTLTDMNGGFVGGTQINVYDENGTFAQSTLYSPDWTAAGGNFSIGGLPPGRYFAQTDFFDASNFVNEAFDNVQCENFCEPTRGTPIVVTAGATRGGINFQVARGDTISGRVTDAATGAAIAGMTVVSYAANGQRARTATTSSSGSYTINGLLPGTHYVRTLRTSAQNYIDQLYRRLACVAPACSVTSGTPILIVSGTPQVDIDFPLSAPRRTDTGDFDGDGKSDLTVFRPSTGDWYSRPALPNGVGSADTLRWGLPGDVPLATDFDGDGRTELTVWRPSNGTWYVRYSSTGYAAAAAFEWGLPGDIPIAADFDRDNKTDLVVWRPSDGTWYIRYSSSGYGLNASATFLWGMLGDVPLAGDFDGDGKTDVAVFRPSTGGWYIRYSAQNYSVPAAAYYEWGLPGDVPLVGDFDGDSRTDISVYRPATGEWYIRYSSLGYSLGNSLVYRWGLPGDLPLTSDFDGDHTTDLAVFRPSTGEWFIRDSLLGYGNVRVYPWGLPGDVPVR